MDQQHNADNQRLGSNLRGRFRRRSLVQGAVAAGVTLPFLGTTIAARPSRSAAAQTEGQGGILVFDLGSEPENLDPHQIVAYTTSLLVGQIAEPLVHLSPENLELEPWLAESWEGAADGLAWTFTLREGVTFHDGTPCDAAAVKFSFDRQLDEANPFYATGQWTDEGNYAMVEEVRVDAPNVVTFVLSTPYNQFVQRLANTSGGWIVSPTAVETLGDAFIESPVGTGPYLFDRWDKGQQVVLRRNDAYWGGTPGLDEIYFRALTEEGARLTALLTGEVTMALDLGPEMVGRLSDSDDHSVVSGPTGSIWFLAMNVESEAFADPRVRQAVNLAVDKRAIVEDVLQNTVTTGHGPLSPAYPEYNPAVESFYAYDPARAMELLAEAEWPADRQVVFRCSIGGSGMLLAEEMATVIQENLRAVGMETALEVTEFVSWMDAIRNAQNELTVMSWNRAPIEPDGLFNGILSEQSLPPGFNTSFYVNEEVEELYQTGRVSTDPEEATAAYQRAQELIMADAPIVPVCHHQQTYALSNTVQNFVPRPNMELDLRQVWVQQ